MEGSQTRHVTPRIVITTMSPEARELLDTIMEAWAGEEQAYRASNPGREPSIYGFAYWLCRYSGLIQAVNPPTGS